MRAAFIAMLIAAAFVGAACTERGSVLLTSTQGGSGGAAVHISGPTSVSSGSTIPLRAAVSDSNGNPVPNPSVAWGSSDTAVAAVFGTTDSASVTGRGVGVATITAASGGARDTITVNVVAPPPPPPLDTVIVSLVYGSTTLAPGDTARFVPRDGSGRQISDSVSWSTSDTSVIEVHPSDATGTSVVILARALGQAILRAMVQGRTGQVTITVQPPAPVASVTVNPPADTLAVGQDSAFFFATLRDAQGTELSGRPVTWTVSDSNVARIQYASGQTAAVRTVNVGSAILTATSEGKSGTAHVLVTEPAPVATVTVTPSADTLVVGDSAAFSATLRDAQGKPLSGRSVTWAISDPSVARIEFASGETAEIRALQAGSAVLTATSEGKIGSAHAVVFAPTPVATVTVIPDSANLAVGDSVWFRADLRDSAGNLLANRTVSWSVTDSTFIDLRTYGSEALVQPRAPGNAILRATSEGKSGEARIVVR